jgi:uncharacterized FlaG/YvyC family protein
MIAVANQIEPVASIIAAQASQGAPKQTSGGQSAAAAEASRKALQSSTPNTPPPPPVVNDHILRLTVEPDTHEVIALVVDPETDDVIREIPPEEMRRAAEVIRAIVGQLVNKVV